MSSLSPAIEAGATPVSTRGSTASGRTAGAGGPDTGGGAGSGVPIGTSSTVTARGVDSGSARMAATFSFVMAVAPGKAADDRGDGTGGVAAAGDVPVVAIAGTTTSVDVLT